MDTFSELVSNAAHSSQAFVDSVNANMETALIDLFRYIDKNNDGVISKEEFSGMSLNAWAMLRALTSCVNCLPTLPSIKEVMGSLPTELSFQALQHSFPGLQRYYVVVEGYSYITIYICCLFGFHIFLFLFENWRYMLGVRCSWRFTDHDPYKNVAKVDKAVALTYDTPLTRYEYAKMFFMTCTGFVFFRMIMAVIIFSIGVFCINIASWYEIKGWRSGWMYVSKIFTFLLMTFFGYMRITIQGRLEDSSKVKLLVANHCCMIEVLVLYTVSKGCAFVSAVENLGVPFFQGLCAASDALIVDRNDPESKKKTIDEIQVRAKRKSGSQLMMFPEGTLNNQQALFQFKHGPFIPGVPVQPVCFRVPYRHFNPCWTGEATGGLNFFDVCYRTLFQFVNRLEMKILPVYEPSEEEQKNPDLFANNVRDEMARALDLPVCDATYQDYKECQTKYAETLKVLQQKKGRFNFRQARQQMHEQRAAARAKLRMGVRQVQETAEHMAEGPVMFQKAHPEGIVSNYEQNEGGYITREGVKKLSLYKYAGGEYSLLDKLLNPFWNNFALIMPRSISPNAVTLTGFFSFCIGLSVLLFDALAMKAETGIMASSGIFGIQLFVAFCMWFYQTMDAVDGKHARNTGQSSPLGALFDHGCDSCAMVVGALCVELSLTHPTDNVHNMTFIHLMAYFMPMTSFYFAQWEHYHIGVLPTSGVTEAQFLAFTTVLSMGINRYWVYTKIADILPLSPFTEWIGSFQILEIMEIFTTLFALQVLITCVHRVVKHTGGIVPLGTLLPFLLHHIQIVLLFLSPSYKSYRILCLFLMGFNFSDLAMRMIISGLCAIRYPFIHWPTVPFSMVSFWAFSSGYDGPYAFTILALTLTWQFISILWLASDTIARICSHLDIPFLASRPKPLEKKD